MAMRKVVEVTDDLDGRSDQPVKTIRLGVEGTWHEIDLNEEHQMQLWAALDPFLLHARKIGKDGARTDTAQAHEQAVRVRAWAKDNGYTVSERGRIPGEVIDAYKEALHPAKRSPIKVVSPVADAEPEPVVAEEPAKSGRRAPSATEIDGGPLVRQQIRQWADKNGYKVKPRGRIPEDVRAAWEKAHAAKSSRPALRAVPPTKENPARGAARPTQRRMRAVAEPAFSSGS